MAERPSGGDIFRPDAAWAEAACLDLGFAADPRVPGRQRGYVENSRLARAYREAPLMPV